MKLKFSSVIVTALITSLLSCASEQNSKVLDDKGISYLESSDSEMQQAIEESRKTFSEFISAYKSKDSAIQEFVIKMPFKTENGNEHMWLNNITIQNNKIYGVVNNDPELTKEVVFGDTVEIDRNKISDWYYKKENKLYGGFSIRLLRSRMTSEEQAEFDKGSGFIIE